MDGLRISGWQKQAALRSLFWYGMRQKWRFSSDVLARMLWCCV
jgi:hypothetical protein